MIDYDNRLLSSHLHLLQLFLLDKVAVHHLGELLRVLLLQVEGQELGVLLQEPLATQQAEGMSFRRRSCWVKVRVGRGWRWRRGRLAKHEITDVLRMVMDKMMRSKS